ncbi:hypothetical protein HaLaN_02423 [Haematococcus lacustris]|uniref:Uncharacterized protein n=1 Tax=Haematococcus lacustris TaxID=44745 RepID=A0A699YI98_HAELA|nr:hypothetical protein HaLaN_02423 [Haematococcus lacustris]
MLLTWQQALEEQSLAAAQARQQLLEQRAKWKAGMADMQQQFEAVQGLVQVLEQRSACHKVELAQAQLAAEEARQQAALEQVSTTRMAAQLALAEAGQKRPWLRAELTAWLGIAGNMPGVPAGHPQPTYPSLLPAADSPYYTAGPAPRPDLPTPSDPLALEVLHAEVSRLVSEREQLLQQLSHQLQLVAAQSQVENLTRQLAAAHSAAATAAAAHASELEEAKQQAKDAQESCRQQVAEAARRATDAERESSKAVVLSRQLERQVARLRDKRASETAGQVADLQSQGRLNKAATFDVPAAAKAALTVTAGNVVAGTDE